MHDLYQAALAAFFAAQEPAGRWPLSSPLFHYPESGNAYCYTFETLAELLRPALAREGGRTYRALLEPYLDALFRAWDYAMQTRIPLEESGETFGWSSTHQVVRSEPEAWATAEVFSFGELLRCVSGHVAAEQAGRHLNVRRPEYASPDAARKVLQQRGRTWAPDGWTVGRELASLFLHPAAAPSSEPRDVAIRDPDAPLIAQLHARSAVLFGPPGTGKTTIVEALAGALGWEYVEILASDFLSEGVDRVPARADAIFEHLMQLDRCVVLFDEIDELIRDRTGERSDPFGRFLTTSMLPKIAKLWKQGRLIFFVATNHVSRADPAITRSSRFDARVFVAPPGLGAKREQLAKLGFDVPDIDDKKVIEALGSSKARKALGADDRALAVLPLLRHDQVPELARLLREGMSLEDALAKLGETLLRHEWQPAKDAEHPTKKDADDDGNLPFDQLATVYNEYAAGITRDFSRQRVMRVACDAVADLPDGLHQLRGEGGAGDAGSASDSFFVAPDDLATLDLRELNTGADPSALTDKEILHLHPAVAAE